jgi:hypothetical protein
MEFEMLMNELDSLVNGCKDQLLTLSINACTEYNDSAMLEVTKSFTLGLSYLELLISPKHEDDRFIVLLRRLLLSQMFSPLVSIYSAIPAIVKAHQEVMAELKSNPEMSSEAFVELFSQKLSLPKNETEKG